MAVCESRRQGLAGIAALALALVLAPTSPATAQSATAARSFPDAASSDMRVAMIGYRLATRGRTLCPRSSPLIGLLLHDPGSYSPAMRDAVATQYGMVDGMGVRGVVPGSAAAHAGLVAGDVIVALNGRPVGQLGLPPLRPTASYDRIQVFVEQLTASLGAGTAVLAVTRGAERLTVTLPVDIGCKAPVALVPGAKPDAWSDAHFAAVTERLVTVAGDDELAFALAHEMAHVVLEHAAEPHGMLTGIGIGGKRSREREREADRLGIMMTIAAGYASSGAHALLARFARANAPAISLTHPSVKARLQAIDEVTRQFTAKPPKAD